jgi:hypothetical protein
MDNSLLRRTIAAFYLLEELLSELEENRANALALEETISTRKELQAMSNWVGFWFDSNQYDGFISTPQLFGKLKKSYSPEELKQARRKDAFDPCFGFRPNFQGETLEEFFKKNGMKL